VIVSDTNTIVYLLMPSPGATENAEEVLRWDPDWRAPALWRSEFRNVLWLVMRRKEMSLSDVLKIMAQADDIVRDSGAGVTSEAVLRLAADSGCSPYDCEFAALARELRCPLITSDRTLLRAFPELAFTPRGFAELRRLQR
jgi:predicted nucleic acid-binding protein